MRPFFATGVQVQRFRRNAFRRSRSEVHFRFVQVQHYGLKTLHRRVFVTATRISAKLQKNAKHSWELRKQNTKVAVASAKLCFRIPYKTSPKEKSTPHGVLFFWRKRWDSNPRAIARKLISSQPRYDHFDTSPSIVPPIRTPEKGENRWREHKK